MLTYQFRLYPNKEQQDLLWDHANKLNGVYNYFLNQRIQNNNLPKDKRAKITRLTQQEELVSLKIKDPSLCEIHSQVLQQVTFRLHKSVKAVFTSGRGFPRLRNHQDFFGICYPQSGFKIKGGSFITSAYGKINFSRHREIKGDIKQVSITNKGNVWYLNVVTDHEAEKSEEDSVTEIGIDIGLVDLVVDNFGNKIKNSTDSRYFDKQISKLQSKRDKLKDKNSRRGKFLSKKIKDLHGAKVRKINDFQHKVSRTLTRKYGVIFAENLSSKNMSETKIKGLNRRIRNAKFGQFLNFLSYKAKKLILVNPYNTSKTCNGCGWINSELKLSDREVACKACNSVYDRDQNAAKNILCLGQAIVEKQCTELTLQEALAFKRE